MQASEFLVHGSIAMARGSLLRVEDGRDLLIYVWDGSLWVTQHGDAHDYYIGAGEWFRIERNGAALAYSLKRTVVSLTAPEPEGYAQRIVLAKAGTAAPVELYSGAGARVPLVARLRRMWASLFNPHARPTSAAL